MLAGADQLRDWIERREVNQREAADLLGITDVFLSQILNGHRQPGLSNAVNIERKTGISVESWLLTEVSASVTANSASTGNRKHAKR